MLCYGDSNTWGFNPATKERFPPSVRWTGILQRQLGDRFRVIEEGLNSRTTVFEDPLQPGRNGLEYLIPCLDSHAPIDLVVLMLGTNDLKRRFSLSAEEIALGAARLIRTIQHSTAGPTGGSPSILLVAPPRIGRLSEFAGYFEGAPEKSKRFGQAYRAIATELGAAFLDTAPLVGASDLDGVHLDEDAHAKLAGSVENEVRTLLP